MENKLLSALLAGFCLTGCSVMHFKNGQVKSAGPVQEKWHHNGIYSLVEFSPVINMNTLCQEKTWSMITTKQTFVTGLVGSVDDVATSVLLPYGGIDLWDPQVIEWSCGAGKSASPAPPAPADSTR